MPAQELRVFIGNVRGICVLAFNPRNDEERLTGREEGAAFRMTSLVEAGVSDRVQGKGDESGNEK